MPDPTDDQRQAAASIWHDDPGDQIAGAQALAEVPPSVGWTVVRESLVNLHHLYRRDRDLHADLAPVLEADAAAQVRECVRRIVEGRLARR